MGRKDEGSFLDGSIGHQLGRAYNHFWRACADRLQPHGITPKQFSLLSLVCSRPGIAQSDVCQRTVSKPPQATNLLDGLAERRLVRRLTSPDDRRHRLWWPTTLGKKTERRLRGEIAEAERALCVQASLPENAAAELLALLAEINGAGGAGKRGRGAEAATPWKRERGNERQ